MLQTVEPLLQFSSVPWSIWSSEGHEGRLSRDPLPDFSARGPCELLLLDVDQAFALSTTASPTLQGAQKDGFWEADVECDVPEPCQCPSPDSRKERLAS